MNQDSSTGQRDILVVDDVAAIRSLLSEFLQNKRYSIETAATVSEARHLMERIRFSLIITNLQLDRTRQRSGCEIVKYAKSSSPPLPVIVITGGAASATLSELSDLGANVVLAKPIRLELLHCFVRELLARRASA